MNRAEMRRAPRESRKAAKTALPPVVPAYINLRSVPKEEIASQLGTNVRLLTEWTTQQKDAMHEEFCKEFNDRLYEAENYIALTNILISCIAIHMTWGYTKAIDRFVKNLNSASNYVKRYGVPKVLAQVNKEYGTEFEFDSFDIIEFIEKAEETERRSKTK